MTSERRVRLLLSAGCVIPALLWVLQQYVSARLNGRPTRWEDVVFSGGDWLFLGALIFIPWGLAKRFPLRRGVWKRSAAAHATGAFTFAVAWASCGMLLGIALHRFPGIPPFVVSYVSWILITIPFAFLIYAALLGFAHAYSYALEAREREAQLAEARLGALRMQLHPHFLFNSLNTVLVLVREENSAGASRMLEQLADVLREVLRTDRPHEIALADELRFLEQYLAIEQVRFSDRLRVEWSIEERARGALVPDFILQPLVENAIRHGVSRRAEGGTVTISARVDAGMLELTVRDNGVGQAFQPSPGVGLSNTRERLRTLYGAAASVTINTSETGGTEAVLKLPYRTS
jgi:signal transduction histidine kinase